MHLSNALTLSGFWRCNAEVQRQRENRAGTTLVTGSPLQAVVTRGSVRAKCITSRRRSLDCLRGLLLSRAMKSAVG